jgi:hypothetical protein
MLLVKPFGDPGVADTARAQLENALHDSGLARVDPPLDMRALARGIRDLNALIAKTNVPAAVACTCLAEHRVGDTLARLLALELVGERGQRKHDLVCRGVERPLTVLEVEEHAHAGSYDLLQCVRRLDRLATES